MFTLHPLLAHDTFALGHLEICQLLLMNDSNYPWFILVPRVENVQEIFELSDGEQHQVLKESSLLGKAVCEAFKADKLNIAALGNVCPQLHIHHIARYHNDPAWPAPVWGKVERKLYNTTEKAAVIEKLQSSLTKNISWY